MSFSQSDEIVVVRFDADGVETSLTEGVHYTLSAQSALPDVGESEQPVATAELTLELSEDALAVGEYLLIQRNTALEQSMILYAAQGFRSARFERALDRMTRMIQELAAKYNRTLAIHDIDPAGTLKLARAADRAGTLLGFDEDGALDYVDNTFVGPQGPPGEQGPPGPSGDGSGDMLKSESLSGIADPAAARAVLQLGTAALLDAEELFQVALNLSEGVAATIRANLGIQSAALQAASAFLAAADLATAAHFRAATANKVLEADAVWDAADFVTLDETALALDLSSGFNFELALTANRTLPNPTNAKRGQSGNIYVVQDGVGGRTLSFGSNYKWAGGVAGVLSTGVNKVDRISYLVRSSSFIELTLAKAIA